MSSKEELYDEVYTLLGDSMIDVELSEKDIDVAFNRAKRKYKQYADNNYIKGYYCVRVDKDCQEHIIPKDIHTIVKVIRPTRSFYTNHGYTPEAFNRVFGNAPTSNNRIDFVSVEFLGQHLDVWRKYFAFDVDFEHNQMMGIVRFLNKPRGEETWLLECYMDMKDEQYREVSWIIDWTLAESKKILGSAYRKFSGVPSPDGSSVQLGGDSMIQEAEKEMEQLLGDIENGTSGDTSWWGISVG